MIILFFCDSEAPPISVSFQTKSFPPPPPFYDSNSTFAKTLVVYGGVDKAPQRTALKQGVHILVATPGRLIDLCEEGSADLSNAKYFILDEADRMVRVTMFILGAK